MDDYMDDVAHDPHSLGQVSRKRKADGEDSTSQDCQSTESMAIDPIDDLLPVPRHHQWPGRSDGYVSTTFLEGSSHIVPTYRSREPKRPKIQVVIASETSHSPQRRQKERRLLHCAEAAARMILHMVTSSPKLESICLRAADFKRRTCCHGFGLSAYSPIPPNPKSRNFERTRTRGCPV